MQFIKEYVEENGGVVKAAEKLNVQYPHLIRLMKKEVIIFNGEIYPKMKRRKQ